MGPNPSTSIVIRAYNEEKHLPALLEGIRSQDYHDFEIILVDSGSYDRTKEIARAYSARVLQIESRDFTFGHSLNVGIEAARGRYIAIVSAHTRPLDQKWLRHLITPLADDNVAMVYGRQLGIEGSKFGESADFRRTFGATRKIHGPGNVFANNANSAVRRDLWEQHPFDEVLPGLEDIAWAMHWTGRGYQVVYEPDAPTFHIHEETWQQLRRRFYREALAAKWLGLKRLRHIPGDVLLEGGYLVQDLLQAGRVGQLRPRAWEIAKYHYEKTRGWVSGLQDGAPLADPRTKEFLYFADSYQAVVIEGPGRAELKTIDLAAPKPGEVLIRVGYVGICGTDVELLDGTLGYYKDGTASYPIIPGHEFSGTVAKAGPNVPFVEPGDRVVAECIQSCLHCAQCAAGNFIGCQHRRELGVLGLNGDCAEYVVVPGEFVRRIPDEVSLKAAALCEPLAVVLKAWRRLQTVLPVGRQCKCGVVGLGTIGYLFASVLRLQGHRVTGFERHDTRRRFMEAANIGVEVRDELRELDGFEVLIEATGDPGALSVVLTQSSAGTTILLVGLPYANQDFSFEEVVAYDKTIIGSVGSSMADFDQALALLPQLDVSQLTEYTLPLEDFQAAWELARGGQRLKVLLRVDPGE